METKIKNLLSPDYFPPIIFYGTYIHNKCKYIVELINDIYNISPSIHYNKSVYKTEKYIIFNLHIIDTKIMINTVINIHNNKLIITKPIIILNNINKNQLNIINILSFNLKFILIVDNLNSIINNLLSHCLCINISENKISHTYTHLINYIFTFYKNNREFNYSQIDNIKELAKYIIFTLLHVPTILQMLSCKLLKDNTIINKRKYNIIKFISDVEHKYTKSYNKFIYLEYILINIHKLMYLNLV